MPSASKLACIGEAVQLRDKTPKTKTCFLAQIMSYILLPITRNITERVFDRDMSAHWSSDLFRGQLDL